MVSGTNISTVSNTEGNYLIKIPNQYLEGTLEVSLLGYETYTIPLSQLKRNNQIIELTIEISQLSEISVTRFADANALVRAVFRKRADNTLSQTARMTAFYRETIKKRNKNASLSEAVLTVYKEPYENGKRDEVSLIKARKSTDYSKLDTLALKLQGGPFSTLYTDMIKYPEYVLDRGNLKNYTFSFDESTQLNNRLVYVVNFKQRINDSEPLYYGKLYIDSQTLALTSAVYNLNVSDRTLASEMFVKKKPNRVKVYPTLASYRVDYRTRNDKWYYGYGKIQLTFKVNWKNRLFNNVYTLSSEMAITDWKISDETILKAEKLRTNVILTDKASGFSDPEFWGEYNIIEPEKSIENAIKKINKQLQSET